MIMTIGFGSAIARTHGAKYVWPLYLSGAFLGALSSLLFLPKTDYVEPRVGADSAVMALATFYGLHNMNSQIALFMFPMKISTFLIGIAIFSLLFEQSKTHLSGMAAGATIFQLLALKKFWFSKGRQGDWNINKYYL